MMTRNVIAAIVDEDYPACAACFKAFSAHLFRLWPLRALALAAAA